MTDQRVDESEVAHVAELARVDLPEEDLQRFVGQFAEILSAFDSLDEVPEVDRDADLTNVMRPDEVEPSLDQSTALANAPECEEGQFKGPNVS